MASEPRSQSESRGAEAHRGHILIVDDEVFIRNSFRLYFETLGFHVSVAANGGSALAELQAAKASVDVVLLDLVMPGLHGIEILRRIKEMDSSIEVIIATGCGSINTAIEALRYGAFDYVTKPIVNFDEDLLNVVTAALASRQAKFRDRQTDGPSPREEPANAANRPDDSFFLALEKLAVESAESASQEGRLKAIRSFLERHLLAAGALVLETSPFGSASCIWRWGALPWEPESEAVMGLWKAMKEILARSKGWRLIERQELPPLEPLADIPDGLEAMRVPISLGEGVANGSATDLIVLGRPGARKGQPPTPMALLSLVVASAMRDLTGRALNF